ncbi:MAG: hypothetical protein WBC44_02045 [Planctomycetaceae bacterium]
MSQRASGVDRYSRLDAVEIVGTVERLSNRIGARFPDSGLRKTCLRLLEIASQASERSEAIGRPIVWLRVLTGIFIALILSLIPLAVIQAKPPDGPLRLTELIQVCESAINDAILIGAAILFFATIEARIKRNRALAAIDELRSLSHIIDMHQLTKDPERVVFGMRMTEASPLLSLTPFELERYLDYCGEMFALLGKIAALYVQHFEDSQAMQAVNDIEQLTTGLSQKVWQKITLLHTMCGARLPETIATNDESLAATIRERGALPDGRG